jgi:hypothetical protein
MHTHTPALLVISTGQSSSGAHQETTAQMTPTTRLVSGGMPGDLQQPPTAETVIWAASRKREAQIPSAGEGFCRSMQSLVSTPPIEMVVASQIHKIMHDIYKR